VHIMQTCRLRLIQCLLLIVQDIPSQHLVGRASLVTTQILDSHTCHILEVRAIECLVINARVLHDSLYGDTHRAALLNQ
jgi:hypothetical protein